MLVVEDVLVCAGVVDEVDVDVDDVIAGLMATQSSRPFARRGPAAVEQAHGGHHAHAH